MDNIGWIGSILLAFCGLPQAIESYKTKSSEGLTWGFISMWFIGEIFTIIYVFPKMDLPLLSLFTLLKLKTLEQIYGKFAFLMHLSKYSNP